MRPVLPWYKQLHEKVSFMDTEAKKKEGKKKKFQQNISKYKPLIYKNENSITKCKVQMQGDWIFKNNVTSN